MKGAIVDKDLVIKDTTEGQSGRISDFTCDVLGAVGAGPRPVGRAIGDADG